MVYAILFVIGFWSFGFDFDWKTYACVNCMGKKISHAFFVAIKKFHA
jgi:hypothetical protein